jgi:phosphoglycolate phosphatase-like HAD superfamily hydrolase
LKKNKLLIFDIDGTLVDSAKTYLKVITQSMKNLGIVTINEDYVNYKHHTDSYALKFNYEQNFDSPFKESLYDDLDDELELELLKYPKMNEVNGASNLIERLHESPYAFAFATGAFPKASRLKLRQANIWFHDELLATSKTSISREGFLLQAIEQAKSYYKISDFEEIISVGDGLWDLQTANNLGLNFVGIGNSYKEVLLKNGCQQWYADMHELKKHLF